MSVSCYNLFPSNFESRCYQPSLWCPFIICDKQDLEGQLKLFETILHPIFQNPLLDHFRFVNCRMIKSIKVYLIRYDHGDEIVFCWVSIETNIFDYRTSFKYRFNFSVGNIPMKQDRNPYNKTVSCSQIIISCPDLTNECISFEREVTLEQKLVFVMYELNETLGFFS